jgi:uncharacterized protein (DUF2384 family)
MLLDGLLWATALLAVNALPVPCELGCVVGKLVESVCEVRVLAYICHAANGRADNFVRRVRVPCGHVQRRRALNKSPGESSKA